MKNKEWNPPSLRSGMTRIENGARQARSVLSVCAPLRRDRAKARGEGGECGDKWPLSSTRGVASNPKRGCVRALQKLARSLVALFCFCLLPSAICLRASGQSYSIDWHKIASGGGTSSNSQYSISGTIGQPDATANAALTGGNYSLTGGFWSFISVMQTAGAPTLHISHLGNTVTVYWRDVSGWMLQQTANLAVGNGGWIASGGVTSANGTNSLSLTAPTVNRFYRLFKP